MSCDAFDPQCPGCRPAILDPETGQALPPEHPTMRVVDRVWDAATREEQEAFWRVTVKNGRDQADMRLCARLTERMARAVSVAMAEDWS